MAKNISQWLEEIGLGQYAQAFAENGIDFEVLPHLSDDDLEKLGLNLGDRRRLQLALEALTGDGHQADGQPSAAQAKTGAPPEAERRQLTVLFCDLVGSTEL